MGNRRSLEEGLDGLARDDAVAAILMLDFDHFKEINDVHGHAIGDAFLRVVATRMRRVIQAFGIVARLGGDEFAVILRRSDHAADAVDIARRLIAAIGEPIEVNGISLMAELSIGILDAPGPGTSAQELLRMADIALYRAKAEQGSSFLLYDRSMEAEFLRRQMLLDDLRQALRLGQFKVYYQALVSAQTGKISSYEALLRWIHPVHGLVLPGEFIPLAEENGLISRIGAWVLFQACRDAATWPETIKISVNVSPRQFRDGSVPAIIEMALSQTGLAPERLVLEITESILLQETDANLETLRRIQSHGVAIALDDFGTGFSSLSYLQSFPFDKVKIDRSFVQRIGTSQQSEKILQAMTGLLTSLDMSVTVEGVETEEQRNWIARLDCKEMQGYLFGIPCPAENIDVKSMI